MAVVAGLISAWCFTPCCLCWPNALTGAPQEHCLSFIPRRSPNTQRPWSYFSNGAMCHTVATSSNAFSIQDVADHPCFGFKPLWL